MAILTIIEKINGAGEKIKHGEKITVKIERLTGIKTGSIYIRTAESGNRFLSQRHNGSFGAGDICFLGSVDNTIEVNKHLFIRLKKFVEKAESKRSLEDTINWSELSRHLLGGDRNAIRSNKIPQIHFSKLDDFFNKELPAWWEKKKKEIKPE